MFGGNTTTPAEPADHPGQPVDNTLTDAPSNGVTPGDEPAQGYDTSYAIDPHHTASPVAADTSTPPAGSTDTADSTPTTVTPAASDDLLTNAADDLVAIKQQALQQLSPLVGHLDQSPEEKFRTTMMMIQASDNADLVKEAFAAAQQITDEKARAQALLDVVNEINYFTQHHDQQPQ